MMIIHHNKFIMMNLHDYNTYYYGQDNNQNESIILLTQSSMECVTNFDEHF